MELRGLQSLGLAKLPRPLHLPIFAVANSVLVLSLDQALHLNYFGKLRGRLKKNSMSLDLHGLQLKTVHMPKCHILGDWF